MAQQPSRGGNHTRATALDRMEQRLALYGDHLPTCATHHPQANSRPACDCGWRALADELWGR